MTRQIGARSQLLAKLETTYGEAPTGNWQKFPVFTYEPAVANDLVDDPVIGFATREAQDPFRKETDLKGGITVPVELNSVGFWLKALLGNYSVTGSEAPYTHVFKALNGGALPSMSCELGHLDAGKYFAHTGLAVDKGSFDFAPTGGSSKLSLNAIAQAEAASGTSGGGTPTTAAYKPFSQFQGNVFIDAAGSTDPATAIANITAAKLDIDNQSEAPYGIGSDGLILGVDPGLFKVSGSITVRFADLTLYNDAINAVYQSLSLGYTIDDNNSLNIVLPRVSLGRNTPKLSGPKGIEFDLPFMASIDTGSNTSLIATLKNTIASY